MDLKNSCWDLQVNYQDFLRNVTCREAHFLSTMAVHCRDQCTWTSKYSDKNLKISMELSKEN